MTLAPVPLHAQPSARQRISLPGQLLASALQAVARRYKVYLLFSMDVVGQRQAPTISGTMSVEQALRTLLEGSGLSLLHLGGRNFVVTKSVDQATAAPPAIPDILVVGKRTQNADIRRAANDVQPYQVVTRREVQATHASTVEELLVKRITPNALGRTLAQSPISGGGAVRSAIDLRGLGTEETLVLIDGRRMPRLPANGFMLLQPDVNGLSPESIERAEILTSTAGGIFGPGATAGVVNLVLRRDYRGGEITATRGITARGDAGQGRIDARVGFTPDHGTTEVMLAYSRSVVDGLRNGDRDYIERGRELRFANVKTYDYTELPESSSVNVTSSNNSPLVLKPAFGGGALGNALTSLPAAGYGSPAAVGAALRANAGKLDLSLPEGLMGRQESLTSTRRTSAVLANVRRRFSDGVEAYVDYIRLNDQGRYAYALSGSVMELAATDPRNPFQQAIGLSFPTPDFGTVGRTRTLTTRLSAGTVVSLPAHWKANFDYSIGIGRQTRVLTGTTYDLDGYFALYGLPVAGRPALDPFGDSEVFRSSMASYAKPTHWRSDQTNRFHDASLRMAGSVLRLPGGPLSATLLLEQRREAVRTSDAGGISDAYATPYVERVLGHKERVRSAYIEMRAPLVASDAPFFPLRSLELQAAVRGDRTRIDVPFDPDEGAFYDRFTVASRAAVMFTLGARARPVSGLLVRASIATGELTAPLSTIGNARVIGEHGPDPKRGNSRILPYEFIVFGNGKITPEHTQSISAGLIATPFGPRGATLTIDYTHIRRSKVIESRYVGSAYYFLRNEALYPDRITRLPLTPEDAARGYTGGVITRIDATYLNLGSTVIDAIDGRLEIPVRTDRAGDFMLRGAATWQPRYRRFTLPENPVDDLVNYADGALRWRGNGGLSWARNSLSLSIDGQYFGGYHITSGAYPQVSNPRLIRNQGRDDTSAQVTLDLAASYRFKLDGDGPRSRTLDLRFGIQDLLDRHPATVLSADGAYSFYDEPRRRRFEFTAATGF
ncbi:TonB-dependent receptor plug domain-containing protein [Sphingomonas faeni]|uniref:TonB-dependent receptor plug domain-containing protein n=1 Tax=Sphingomonas faeni TaxID=185950 RepID=UPI0027D84EC8|nr:TonB-dependent receptor plug domain-containing protein [Sphingomonas faeni]